MRMRTLLFIALATACIAPQTVIALDVPAPDLVVDNAQVLDETQEDQLRTALLSEQERSGTQIAILTINSLEDEGSIEQYAIKVAREWGVGLADFNNGALLLASIDDRRLRIEVGSGLEGSLTDAESGRIIDNRIAPEFREMRYADGLLAGIDGIALAIADDFNPAALSSDAYADSGDFWFSILFFGFIGIQWLGAILGRSKSWWAGGVVGGFIGSALALFEPVDAAVSIPVLGALGLGLDYLVSRNYSLAKSSGRKPSWWAGGAPRGRSTRSSGGFGGFGGGGFSGGGSSGSW